MPNIGNTTNRIYLSPHFDDIAFSLGTFAARHPGGVLINVFTRGANVAATGFRVTVTPALVEQIGAVRDAEDAQFAAGAGLSRLALGAEEPMLRDRRVFDPAGLDDDIGQIRALLRETLDHLTADAPADVFCPAGIGRHVNHLAVRAVALEWFGQRGAGSRLFFYEDLPYAGRLRRRWRDLKDLRAAAGDRLVRHSWRAAAGKLAQIGLYSSQHKVPVTNLWRFSPAAPWPIGPHEAVWELKL